MCIRDRVSTQSTWGQKQSQSQIKKKQLFLIIFFFFIETYSFNTQKKLSIHKMGGKPQPPEKKKTLDEQLFEMKMAARQFEINSQKAMKEKEDLMRKAQNAVNKNQEEQAKLYIKNAKVKEKESKVMLDASLRLEGLQVFIKSQSSQLKMTEMINKITPMLQQNINNMPIEELTKRMDLFNDEMNKIQIQQTVTEQLMGQQMGLNSVNDNELEGQLNAMRQVKQQQEENQLQNNGYQKFNELNLQQLMQNQNQQQVQDLKK
eukprot:TRINITY_DN8443_c0_g1_i7.p1 TRINITY_DN8443_c0_g1~~TRINITY_DN8443_c0_g1_i7.p1  ORF type:complete len:261 (-),score=75.24 TRINITY_DN8443_c0_g1_i7:107-889(-)